MMDVAATIGCTVDELGERMSSEELALWLARWRIEPFGPHTLMRVLAEVLAALANGPLERRDKRLWQPTDFFDPRCWQAAREASRREPTIDELRRAFGGD